MRCDRFFDIVDASREQPHSCYVKGTISWHPTKSAGMYNSFLATEFFYKNITQCYDNDLNGNEEFTFTKFA